MRIFLGRIFLGRVFLGRIFLGRVFLGRVFQGRVLSSAVVLSAAAVLFAVPATAGAATQGGSVAPRSGYHIVDLGTLGGDGYSGATAINEAGHIVGNSNSHAVMWRDGRIIDLGVLPGGRESVASDINDRDEVVGTNWSADDQVVHAFLWRKGRMYDLGALPGGDYSMATAINNAGEVVGGSVYERTDPETWHAVRWHNRHLIDMESGTTDSFATDITDNGWIVGTRAASAYTGPRFSVAWRGDRPTVLTGGVATAANERHQVVGYGTEDDQTYLWSRGRVTARGVPDSGINDRGQIVGSVYANETETGYAVLWERGHRIVLPSLFEYGAGASAINNRGQIVGAAATSPYGVPRAVLWTR